MTVQVYENGVLIWYDTANALDGVLRRVGNLAHAYPQDSLIQSVAVDAQKIRTEINTAIENRWHHKPVKESV
jgi:hypothetical protein